MMGAPEIDTEDNLRVIFDDAAIDDLLLAAEINGAVGKHGEAVQAGDLLAEMEAAKVLLALLGRLQKPARALILQNRDRGTPAMIAQMNQIASGPDYYRVAPTKEFASGTPIVFGNDNMLPSGAVIGRKDKAVSADGQRFPVRYAVVEAADLLTSNKADGTAIDAYAGGAHGKLRAIAGNGRLAGLIASFDRGTAADYVRELAEDDAHGISPEAIAGFKQPVLVRIMNQEDVTENIGDISNQRGTSDLSPVEQAQNDSKRLDLSELDIADDGKPSEAAAMAFIAAMPESERNNLMDGKNPSQKAYDRLMATVFWKAYGDAELVRLYAQSVDPEVKTILGGMASASGDLAKLEGAGELDIRSIITEAAGLAVNAKRQGVKLSLFAQQADMTISPDTMDVVKMFAENIRSAKKIGERLRAVARFALDEFTKEDTDMFGAVEKASRAQVLTHLEAPIEAPGASLFDAIDPILELELSGKLVARTAALAEAGEDDPMATVTISGEIIAIIQQLKDADVPDEPMVNESKTFTEPPEYFTENTHGTRRYRVMKGLVSPNSAAARQNLQYKVVGSSADFVAENARLERKGNQFFLTYDWDKTNPTTVEVEGEPTPDSVEYQNGFNESMKSSKPVTLTDAKMRSVSEQWKYGYQAGIADRKQFPDSAEREDILSFMASDKAAALEVSDEPTTDVDSQMESQKFKALNDPAFKRLTSDFRRSLAVIIGIDNGTQRGYDRALFVNSIVGKIKTQAKNDPDMAALLLAWLSVAQSKFAKPAVTERNGVWAVVEQGWQRYMALFQPLGTGTAATAPAPAPVATFKNDADGIEVNVFKIDAGYSVAVKDVDSGETLGTILIYPEKDAAIAKAKLIAEGKANAAPVPEAKQEVTEAEGRAALAKIRQFMPKGQRAAIAEGMNGEEAQFFFDKMVEMAALIGKMHKTYDQDGLGNKAIVTLHYFRGNSDWYITEKDMTGNGTEQAFGYTILNGDRQNAELGYISIEELVSRNVELDLHWEKRTLAMVKNAMNEADDKAVEAPAAPVDPVAAMLAQAVADPIDHEAWTLPKDTIEAMPQADFDAIMATLTDENFHSEALIMRAARLGTAAQRYEAVDIRNAQLKAGSLTPELGARAAALAVALSGVAAPEPVDVPALANVPSKEMKESVLRKGYAAGKDIERIGDMSYLAAKHTTTGRGIFVVDGTLDRATYKRIAAEAAEFGLSGEKVYVYGDLATYTGEGIIFMRLDEFPQGSITRGTPAPTPQDDVSMESLISISADSIAELRRIDVYRVLNSAGNRRVALADFIVANRADLKQEVTNVMIEEFPEAGWGAGKAIVQVMEPVLSEVSQPLVETQEVPPVPEAEAAPAPAANPQRADMAFLQSVISQSVDMWNDDLADKIEKLGEVYAGDADMEAAWGDAIKSYTDFMVEAMSKP